MRKVRGCVRKVREQDEGARLCLPREARWHGGGTVARHPRDGDQFIHFECATFVRMYDGLIKEMTEVGPTSCPGGGAS